MIEIIWEFSVEPTAISRFREAYGPDGAWARLFRQHPGFEGLTLLEDIEVPGRFLTIDRWIGEAHYRAMMDSAADQYAALDREFDALTTSERAIGRFRSP